MSKSKPAKIKKAKQGARKRQPTDGGLADDALEQVVGGVDVAGMPAGGQIVAAPYPEGGAAQVIEALKNPETMVLSQGVAIPASSGNEPGTLKTTGSVFTIGRVVRRS